MDPYMHMYVTFGLYVRTQPINDKTLKKVLDNHDKKRTIYL